MQEQTNPTEVKVEVAKVVRVNGCNIRSFGARSGPQGSLFDLEFACGRAPPTKDNWWGSGEEPLGMGLLVGDCVLWGEKYYCVSSIDVGRGATFTETYERELPEVLRRLKK